MSDYDAMMKRRHRRRALRQAACIAFACLAAAVVFVLISLAVYS